ncbi:hypothetical protein NLX86_01205 [Streptomyces sp. A3M-1-3]|uniref:hypothetical protein n=1 Tax=Streptomyces sp. A3M-1-3 TaxID=2962044 RepID=UPI0020B72C21|nr:hypothetical protein [Streptomyces sp. A3M-1-3]MCP3816803.1 hypothetical protein [Streptomyces sp. A3M-1-3]
MDHADEPSVTQGIVTREYEMFEYETHKLRHDQLIREAATARQVRQAAKARRAARRAAAGRSGQNDQEGTVSALRSRFTRAA